jgi:hypothetical protein
MKKYPFCCLDENFCWFIRFEFFLINFLKTFRFNSDELISRKISHSTEQSKFAKQFFLFMQLILIFLLLVIA